MQLWGKGALGFREGIPPIDAFIIQNENEQFSKKIEKQTQKLHLVGIWVASFSFQAIVKIKRLKHKDRHHTLDDGIQVPQNTGSL